MFGSLTKLAEAAVAVVATPITAATDLVTGCGIATDRDEPYTVTALKSAASKVGQAVEELGK